MSENNTASSGNFYMSSREIKKSFDEFKEMKEFLENVNKRFAPLEEINEIAKNFGTIGSETLQKEEKITPTIKDATNQIGSGTLKKETEKDKYLAQLEEESRKLHEEAQKLYAEYKKMDKGSERDEFKVMVAKFMARNKKSMEYLDKMIEALEIDIAIKNYKKNSLNDRNTTDSNEASQNNESNISRPSVASYSNNSISGNSIRGLSTLKANSQTVLKNEQKGNQPREGNTGR